MSDIGAAELISVAWIKAAMPQSVRKASGFPVRSTKRARLSLASRVLAFSESQRLCGIAAGIYNKQNVNAQ